MTQDLQQPGPAQPQDPGEDALRQVLSSHATPPQIDEFLGPVTRGEVNVWHTCLDPEHGPAEDGVDSFDGGGVTAAEDGDDYILNGWDRFTGPGAKPDLLWVLVHTRPAAGMKDDAGLAGSCLVPATWLGVSFPGSRRLTDDGPRPVAFHGVRVPRYYLLGLPGEGGGGSRLMPAAIAEARRSQERRLDHTATGEPETSGLHQRLLDLAWAVNDPDRREVLLQLVMDAYIDCRVTRLFRLRDEFLEQSWEQRGEQSAAQSSVQPDGKAAAHITYHRAQTRLWEGRAAKRLSEAAGQVMGLYSLLDGQDPRAPADGEFEAQQRGSVAGVGSDYHWLLHRNTVARSLGMAASRSG